MAAPHLLDMPPEILHRILRECLVAGVIAHKDDIGFFEKPKIAVPVLRTCKILYEAGLPIFYSENVFYFEQFKHLRTCLKQQRVYNKSLVKHILILNNKGAADSKVKLWHALPGLKSYNVLKGTEDLSRRSEMPSVVLMRDMWGREGQPVDFGVVAYRRRALYWVVTSTGTYRRGFSKWARSYKKSRALKNVMPGK
ncbi:hypothetical protein FKW77_008992 [Venturia effusa]|uniref:F-box domain-containing protein n=1 Tax=Venturia effusa TaxID=50376 RepID=A0A517LBI9_9PEZI|nr:hypothetical protein FKW77_008992 [Venturia effusa]